MQFDKLRTMTTDTDKCLCRASEQLINQIDKILIKVYFGQDNT